MAMPSYLLVARMEMSVIAIGGKSPTPLCKYLICKLVLAIKAVGGQSIEL
jgi:hypothetical protein